MISQLQTVVASESNDDDLFESNDLLLFSDESESNDLLLFSDESEDFIESNDSLLCKESLVLPSKQDDGGSR